MGNIEVVFPSFPGEEIGDPQAGDVDKRPEKCYKISVISFLFRNGHLQATYLN